MEPRLGLALLAVFALGAKGRANLAPADLVREYNRQDSAKGWSPSADAITTARVVLRNRRSQHVERAAADFCLAMGGESVERSTTEMVSEAKRCWPSSTGYGDALQGLAFALKSIAIRRHGQAAWRYLLVLNFDGAPGEAMEDVRGDMFRTRARDTCRHWISLSGSEQRVLVKFLVESVREMPRYRLELRSKLSRGSRPMRVLYAAVCEELSKRGKRPI